jgi:hypothetical protein
MATAVPYGLRGARVLAAGGASVVDEDHLVGAGRAAQTRSGSFGGLPVPAWIAGCRTESVGTEGIDRRGAGAMATAVPYGLRGARVLAAGGASVVDEDHLAGAGRAAQTRSGSFGGLPDPPG